MIPHAGGPVANCRASGGVRRNNRRVALLKVYRTRSVQTRAPKTFQIAALAGGWRAYPKEPSSRIWMKSQPLLGAPTPVKSQSRVDDIAESTAMGIRIRSWIRVGLFADEFARLLPAKSLLELLQTKDVNELSVLQNRAGTSVNFASRPRLEKPDQVAKKRDRDSDLALQYGSQALIFRLAVS
jgi:hypothetical protein